jgi:hypothetical protein
MKNIQIRAVQIISDAFRFIVEIVLNVKLYLLLICQQLNMIIYDALLRLIISSTYSFIKNFRVLFNRSLIFNQTQHQRMLYAQLSSLQKLKIKYAAVFNKDFVGSPLTPARGVVWLRQCRLSWWGELSSIQCVARCYIRVPTAVSHVMALATLSVSTLEPLWKVENHRFLINLSQNFHLTHLSEHLSLSSDWLSL